MGTRICSRSPNSLALILLCLSINKSLKCQHGEDKLYKGGREFKYPRDQVPHLFPQHFTLCKTLLYIYLILHCNHVIDTRQKSWPRRGFKVSNIKLVAKVAQLLWRPLTGLRTSDLSSALYQQYDVLSGQAQNHVLYLIGHCGE